MSDNITIARPYAEGAFSFAKEHNQINEWKDFLETLNLLVLNSKIVQTAEIQSFNDSLAFIEKVLDGYLDKFQKNFVRLLLENSRLKYVKEIKEEFDNLVTASLNKQNAIVISFSELSQAEKSKIKSKLESKSNCSVDITYKIDKSLIGGVIIKIGDEVIDFSIRSRLDKLSKSLQS